MMCKVHGAKLVEPDADWDAVRSEASGCPACQELTRAESERIQRENTIDPSQSYGAHVLLTCKNHPDLRWHTKNIGYIGARTIFSVIAGDDCTCPVSDLILVAESSG